MSTPTDMQILPTSQSPFTALTFIAAPALLTNTSSVLILSTINRMLRTRDSMRELLVQSERGIAADGERLVAQVNRVERQAALLLRALRAIYIALAAFASATLVTLLGAGLAPVAGESWSRALAGFGIGLGVIGVGGLVFGCVYLFRATQISLLNIREEAAIVRRRVDGERASKSRRDDRVE